MEAPGSQDLTAVRKGMLPAILDEITKGRLGSEEKATLFLTTEITSFRLMY